MVDEDIKLGRKQKDEGDRKKQKSFTLTPNNVNKVIPTLMRHHKKRSESELIDLVLEMAWEVYLKAKKIKL